ncbi:hypothetical protein Tco_0507200 [Tanacetum coccineum]
MGVVGISGVEVVCDDECEATAVTPTSSATRTSTEIEPLRITCGIEDPTLLSNKSEEIEITEAAIKQENIDVM